MPADPKAEWVCYKDKLRMRARMGIHAHVRSNHYRPSHPRNHLR